MTEHQLKIWPGHFQAVMNGTKTFEVRKDDRDYKVDDKLRLNEWLPFDCEYTGSGISVRVTYVLRDPEYVKDGYVIMAIEPWREKA